MLQTWQYNPTTLLCLKNPKTTLSNSVHNTWLVLWSVNHTCHSRGSGNVRGSSYHLWGRNVRENIVAGYWTCSDQYFSGTGQKATSQCISEPWGPEGCLVPQIYRNAILGYIIGGGSSFLFFLYCSLCLPVTKVGPFFLFSFHCELRLRKRKKKKEKRGRRGNYWLIW